jgi:hypothetical protein
MRTLTALAGGGSADTLPEVARVCAQLAMRASPGSSHPGDVSLMPRIVVE